MCSQIGWQTLYMRVLLPPTLSMYLKLIHTFLLGSYVVSVRMAIKCAIELFFACDVTGLQEGVVSLEEVREILWLFSLRSITLNYSNIVVYILVPRGFFLERLTDDNENNYILIVLYLSTSSSQHYYILLKLPDSCITSNLNIFVFINDNNTLRKFSFFFIQYKQNL